MIEPAPERSVLADGTVVVSEHLPYVPSVSIGVWVGTGSKFEAPGAGGISHFIEHMVFKGTERRSAFEIAHALESVGGSLDAFTGREMTCYYARVLEEHLPLAVDVLADLVSRPVFEPASLALEKKVVIDEIHSFEDDPDDFAHDVLARVLWKGHPLSRPIMGSVEEVSSFERDDLVRYLAEHYLAGSVVIAAAGAVDHGRLVDLAGGEFRFPAGARRQRVEGTIVPGPRATVITREEGQEYISLGSRAVSYLERDRYPLLVLSTLMGGGMSSRLFQKVREEKGLAYSVFAYLECFAETGLWAAGLSLKPEWTREALELIFEEFRVLVRDGLRGGELESAKAQLRGSTLLSLESTSNRMSRLARAEFTHGRQLKVGEMVAAIESVKPEDVLRVAERVLDPSTLSMVMVGPLEERDLPAGFISP